MPLPSDLLCARIVVQRGFATEERVRECLDLQAKNRAVGYDESLHAVLVKRGFLSAEDARKVERDLALAQFVRAERIFARICVEKNVLSADAAKELLQKQKDDGYKTRFGEMLVEQGKLDRAARDAIAEEQVKRLEEEDEAARKAELAAQPPLTPSRAVPRPPQPPSDMGEIQVPRTSGRATDAALAAFQRDKRKFAGSGEHTPLGGLNGAKIEGFELVSRLGQGSVGVVWKARPKGGGEIVGLKVLSPSLTRNPDLLARFQKAYERAQAIEHPALVSLGPLARSGDLWYYTMELVEGEALGDRVERGGALPAAKTREMAREVARALAHVHGQRVLHGGIRPSNVLIGRDGSIKVADLILARIAPRLSGEASTDQARLYSSPEELTGAAGADPRDDVYSFGLVLYYALVGRHAFPDAQTSTRLMGPVDPREADSLADPELSAIVVRCTAPSREGRFRDAHELLAAIDPRAGSERVATLGKTAELPPSSLDKIGGAVSEPAAAREARERNEKRAPRTAKMPASPQARVRTGPGDTDEVSDPFERPTARRRRTSVPLPGSPGADLTGQVVNGRYRILDKLGEGGMGVVYRAEHTLMAKTIAFKVLHPSLVKSEESVARFQREVLAMAQFAHRNVVRIYDAGKTEDGRLYMAMELVDGKDLATILEQTERVPPARTVAIVRQVLRAIGEAHAKNIVHRDLKPENVLLATGPAGEEVVKVMDFGIAKILEQDDSAAPPAPGMFRTMERIVLGTPEYMSPEQASGTAVDHRSDLYSLGVIAYEMLLGRLPFDADSPVGFIGKHIVDPPLTFAEGRPDHGLSPALEAFVMKALEKDPLERFQSADEMLRGLEEAAPREAADAAAQSLQARAISERTAASAARKPLQAIATGASSKRLEQPKTPEPSKQAKPSSKTSKKPVEKSSSPLALVAVLAVLALAVGGTALGLLLLRVPFEKRLKTAQETSEAAVKKGDWQAATAPFVDLLAKASEKDKPAVQAEIERVAKLEAAAREQGEKKARFDAALAAANDILTGRDLSQEKALAQTIEKARAEQVDPAAVALLEKRAKKWRTAGHRELGERLMSVPSELSDARDELRSARETADELEQKAIDEKILDVEALIDDGKARKALEASAFEEAERYATKALKRKETPERTALLEKIRTRSAEFDVEQRKGRIAKWVDEGALAEREERFDDAKRRYESADAEAARAPEISEPRAGLKEKIANAGRKIDAIKAFSALPPLADASSEEGKKKAVEAREQYLADFPDGPRSARVKADLESLKKAVVDQEKMQASGAFDKAVQEARAALGARNEAAARAALEAAKKAVETLGTKEAKEQVEKLASEIDQELALSKILEKDYVAVPEGKAPEGFAGTLHAFWIGTTEVTNSQYYEFCEAIVQAAKADLDAVKAKNDVAATASARETLAKADARWPENWAKIGDEDEHLRVFPGGQGNLPVAGVSFEDAQAFCAWKTAHDGKAVHIRFRVPKEAEWERAARGDDGRKYPWGNEWTPDDAAPIGGTPSECDAKKWEKGKSPFGAVHMSGNVAEWVDDLYVGKDGEAVPDTRVAKGGSFRSFTPELQLQVTGPSSREKLAPTERKGTVGFRVLVEIVKD